MEVVSGGPILNNGTQPPAEKSNIWRLKENEIYLIKAWMNAFAETETNEEKEIYEDIWVRKFYYKSEKERKILETLLWIFTCSHNTTIVFLYIIPYYSQQIWKIIFYGRPRLCKGTKITVFIKNKIICIGCTDVFLRILQNFQQQLFYRTPWGDCFWLFESSTYNYAQIKTSKWH